MIKRTAFMKEKKVQSFSSLITVSMTAAISLTSKDKHYTEGK